ncbi:MAG: hypothetical protein LBH43_05100 [Treponema sp.]|nr:hypothetical protein [Treponema sp.]
MKRFKLLAILAMALVLGMTVAGCKPPPTDDPDNDPALKNTVWEGSTSTGIIFKIEFIDGKNHITSYDGEQRYKGTYDSHTTEGQLRLGKGNIMGKYLFSQGYTLCTEEAKWYSIIDLAGIGGKGGLGYPDDVGLRNMYAPDERVYSIEGDTLTFGTLKLTFIE